MLKIKEVIIGICLAVISQKMIILIGPGVLKPNSFSEFEENVILTDTLVSRVLKSMDWVKR